MVIAKRERMNKMLNTPYFGRIDFRREGNNNTAIPIYIGIYTYYDFDLKSCLIYDWRAPVSSMYYDYELVEAFYNSSSAKIKGEILLKRQYRIRNGIMEYMIESSITIHDDVLQKELSTNSDDRMKNIVATIQREQNKIIRNNESRVLIIQGVAGSGKTSIALHRIAYLLYVHKESILSKDILIISPNKVFADYISNVLPELGEENVPESTMDEIFSGILEQKCKYLSFSEQSAELLEEPSLEYVSRIKCKSSLEFTVALDNFLIHVENTYFRATDIKVRHLTIPHEYLSEQFRRFHRYPVRQRFDAMAEYIADELQIKYGTIIHTSDRKFLQKKIKGMFRGNNDLQLYKEFFEWVGLPKMFKMRRNKVLEHSDLAPLSYLRIVLDGLKPYCRVKHLLIDEMQDYSPIQYKVIQKLFPCRKTILGDASQSLIPYGSSTAGIIQKIE